MEKGKMLENKPTDRQRTEIYPAVPEKIQAWCDKHGYTDASYCTTGSSEGWRAFPPGAVMSVPLPKEAIASTLFDGFYRSGFISMDGDCLDPNVHSFAAESVIDRRCEEICRILDRQQMLARQRRLVRPMIGSISISAASELTDAAFSRFADSFSLEFGIDLIGDCATDESTEVN